MLSKKIDYYIFLFIIKARGLEFMINIAILDDEIEQVNIIKNICLNYFLNMNTKINISTFDKSKEFLKSNYTDLDVLFLDIEMPNHSGIEIAHEIRSINKKCFICFITNYSDYIFDSYDVHAFDYIMKPINGEKTYKLLTDILKYMNVQSKSNNIKTKFITVDGELFIKQNEIAYFEYQNTFKDSFYRVTILHTMNKEYILKERLKDIMMKLDDTFFVAPHKSFIVNMDYIKQISKNEIIMQNNDKIPLSQKKSSIVRKKFTQYIHLFYEGGTQ